MKKRVIVLGDVLKMSEYLFSIQFDMHIEY